MPQCPQARGASPTLFRVCQEPVTVTTSRKYRPSRKREATAQQMRDRIHAGAWTAFVQHGMDGTSITEIVRLSGISTGTFYNYYGTKEAVFDEILGNLTTQIRVITARARRRADGLEAMLRLSYKELLDFVLALDGAQGFVARNQHHIRRRLSGSDGTEGILDDLRADILRSSGTPLPPLKTDLIARLIVATGVEALVQLGEEHAADTEAMAELMTALLTRGISAPTKT